MSQDQNQSQYREAKYPLEDVIKQTFYPAIAIRMNLTFGKNQMKLAILSHLRHDLVMFDR